MMDTNYKNDMEINLVDFAWNLIYRWKIILLVAVLGLGLGAGYKVYSNYGVRQSAEQAKNSIVSEEEVEKNLEEELASLQEELTELELANVDFALESKAKLDDTAQYQSESIYQNLDPDAVDCVRLTYMIDNGYTFNYSEDVVPNNAAALKFAYMDYINNGMLVSDISRKLSDIDISYLKELISSCQSSETNAVEMISLVVYGSDAKQAQKIAAEVETAIDSYSKQVKNRVGEHELTLVSETVGVVSDQNVAATQNAIEATLTDYRTKVVNYRKDFTDQQKRLYDLLAYGESKQTKETQEMPAEQPETAVVQVGLMDSVPKFAVLGCMVGAFLTCMVIACIYLFNGSVKTGEELTDLFGLYLLGNYDEITEGKSKLENLRRKQKWTLAEKRKLTIANVKVLCKKYGIEKLYLASTLHLEQSAVKEIEAMTDALRENNIEAVWGENVLHDAAAMEQMSAYEYVVLVEKTNLTRYEDVAQLLSARNEQKNKLLGAIIL